MTFTRTAQEQFYRVCHDENYRQVEKWGIQHHDIHKWLAILTEEVGEAAKASIEADGGEPDVQQTIKELIHVAAVCASIVADKSWQSR